MMMVITEVREAEARLQEAEMLYTELVKPDRVITEERVV
jgi:hypothetical protein